MRKLQDASTFTLNQPAYQLNPILLSLFPFPLFSACMWPVPIFEFEHVNHMRKVFH